MDKMCALCVVLLSNNTKVVTMQYFVCFFPGSAEIDNG